MKELIKNLEELNRNALTYFWKRGRLSNLINW